MQKDHCPGSEELCQEIVDVQLNGKEVIRGNILLRYLHSVSFEGISADRIEFDENGDRPSDYNIINLKVDSNKTYPYITVGTWDIRTLYNTANHS